MAISFGKAQKLFLQSGDVLNYGGSKTEFEALSLNSTAKILAQLAAEFALMARENLNKADRNASGFLADSIINLPVRYMGKVLVAEVSIASYYEFIDQGVKGWKNTTKAPLSPFQFKKTVPNKDGGTRNSEMVTSIRKWLIKEGLKGRNNKYSPISKREEKRKKITDTSTQRAIAIAGIVKRDGLKPSYFWMKTVAIMKKRIEEEFGKSLKIDVINAIS